MRRFALALMVFGGFLALAAAVLSGFLLVAVFIVLGCLGYDCVAIPCVDVEPWESDYCGCEWVPPADIGDWAWVGVMQAIALSALLVSLGLARAFFRRLTQKTSKISKTGVALAGSAWAVGIALMVMVDLAVYIDQWVEWAHFKVIGFNEPYLYPSEQVRLGVLVASAVALAAAILAVCLWRRGRRERPASPVSPTAV